MIKTKNVTVIDCLDWDDLVQQTYQKPYRFQQQNGCQERGMVGLTIPSDYTDEEYMHDSIPEVVNGDEMGVKFEVWLARDPNEPLRNKNEYRDDAFGIGLFWDRNFYPSIYTVANDLYKKGLIEAGDYMINIDW